MTYEKSRGTGETTTLTLSSPLDPGGPKATTGSFTFLRRFSSGRSSDLSSSAFPAALYNKDLLPTKSFFRFDAPAETFDGINHIKFEIPASFRRQSKKKTRCTGKVSTDED
ncbi:hypothetical protein Ccrd_010495 [Cynara cardunculus var. scolymus]|uniref:Uncharacterized protein n=1 Tax=Cynara cardunculus var. scolymus TaxID=59895 RepID=A0A103YL61_CYNCS|nr:hypothetical protein Ccrd_010495 [Cynara cardunculus var. scolymus]